jgi:hypothetical protein
MFDTPGGSERSGWPGFPSIPGYSRAREYSELFPESGQAVGIVPGCREAVSERLQCTHAYPAQYMQSRIRAGKYLSGGSGMRIDLEFHSNNNI